MAYHAIWRINRRRVIRRVLSSAHVNIPPQLVCRMCPEDAMVSLMKSFLRPKTLIDNTSSRADDSIISITRHRTRYQLYRAVRHSAAIRMLTNSIFAVDDVLSA